MLYNENCSKNTIFFLVIVYVTVAQLAWFMYLPSLPHMVNALHASPKQVQMTASLFVLANALSQLIYGPISDIYGRRPILISGGGIFLVGSALAATAGNIHLLLVARVIQGLGIGAIGTIGRAIPRDLFTGHEYARKGSQIAMALSLMPLIAPIMGGYIQFWFDWRANFIVILTYGIIIWLLVVRLLPETNPQLPRQPLKINKILSGYWQVLTQTQFLGFVLIGGLGLSAETAYGIAAPFLLQVRVGISAAHYGWLSLFTVCGFVLGAFTSSRLVTKKTTEQLLKYGISLICLGGSAMFILALTLPISIITVLGPMLIFMAGIGFIYPNSSVGAMRGFTHVAGAASAVISSLQLACAGVISVWVAHLHAHTAAPLALIMIALGIACWLLYYQLIHRAAVNSPLKHNHD